MMCPVPPVVVTAKIKTKVLGDASRQGFAIAIPKMVVVFFAENLVQ